MHDSNGDTLLMSAIDKVFPILSGTFGNRRGGKSQEDYGPTVAKLLTKD